MIRLWKAGWREADLVDFIRENEIWIDLSASDVADMAEAGIPRGTIDKIVDEIDANEPRRAPVQRTYRPRGYPTYGYYDPYYYPRYPRWSAHIDFGHFGFGHHGGHFGGGHHGGGHHGGVHHRGGHHGGHH